MASLAFRSQTSGNDSSFSASSINATLPAGTRAGDLQIIWISAGLIPPTAAPTIITPAGWTLAGSAAQTIASAGVNIRIHLFYKVAGPSEGTENLAISGGANGAFGWGRLSYQNQNPTVQVAQVTFGQNTATTSAVLTGITTGAVNALLQTFLTQGVAQTATPPGSMAERIDNAAGGFEIADELQAVPGPSGTRTFTLPTSADYAWGFAELRSNNAVTSVYPLFAIGGPFGAGPFGEVLRLNADIISPIGDGWDWDAEDYAELDATMEIVESTQVQQPVLVTAAQPPDDFVAEAEYEDPIADLVEASTGPVQANAPPADQPADDAWSWLNDPDDSSDPWWPDESAPTAETPVAADQPTQDAWPWDDETPDELALLDEAPVGANEPAIAPDDAWTWDDPADEADLLLGSEPVGDNQPAIAVDEPGDDAPADPDDWWHEGAAPVADAVLVVADQPPQAEPDFAEDVSDEYCDESGPVGADAPVVQADQPQDDAWDWADDAHDDLQEPSAPVPDAVLADQLLADDFAPFDVEVEDDLPADGFLNENEPPIAAADAWDWVDDEQDDTLLLIDAVLGADEPPIAAADAWNWDEEPADDDAWWQQAEHVLVDFVQLAGPTYAEDWDWSGEDTDDDDWWAEIPQPDAGALPPDTCPAQLAQALARIAELEALLAAALANAGAGLGGGGDNEPPRPYDNWREEERARIERNNALIMALAGAVVHGIRNPKDRP